MNWVQEVVFGHAGFLDGAVYANVPLAWLEHHLLSPVMARYAQARPLEILYETEGAWLDATAMARLDSGGVYNRVRIRYDNGLGVTVNGDSNAWAAGSWILPDMGWVAEHNDLRENHQHSRESRRQRARADTLPSSRGNPPSIPSARS